MRTLLSPLSAAFTAATTVRECLYRRDILKSTKLEKPVISVGNLTVGGTGKSPMVDVILTQLENKGLRPCVLTRGYGRRSLDPVVIGQSTGYRDAGDEPLWLYQRHPKAGIAVGSDRVASAEKVGSSNIDVYVLDDGLQHHRIRRDLEITLIDATRPLWHYRPLPWGFAREGWKALKRSDIVVLTRSNLASSERIDFLADRVFGQGVREVIQSSLEIESVRDLVSGKDLKIQNKKVFLVSAIANPQSFDALVTMNKATLTGHERLADHYDYKLSDILVLLKKAKATGADFVLITEKDAVKWREQIPGLQSGLEIPACVVSTRLTFEPDVPDFYDLATHHLR